MRTIRLDAIHQDPANARTHGERNQSAILSSIEEFGALGAVVVEKDTGRILAGNARTAAALKAGIVEGVVVDYDPRTQIPVIQADLRGIDATRFALADNRTAELADWDEDVLKALLAEAGDMGDMWTASEVEALFPATPSQERAGGTEPAALTGDYAILVKCSSELHQRELIERLADEGLDVRAWAL